MSDALSISAPRIVDRRATVVSPWVTLVARDVQRGAAAPETYHAFQVADYVSVLAVTADGRVPLVRQFRPAVERVTLELPGGLIDPGEDPAASAARELHEECGMIVSWPLRLLGRLETDVGRLNNRTWAYFAADVRRDEAGWAPEPGVEVLSWSITELGEAVRDGHFSNAPHVAMIGLALLHGLIQP